MGLASQIKPISYLKAHAAEIAQTLHEKGEPLIITQNGEAKLVVMDIHSYDQMQETFALLQLLSLSERQAERGECETVDQAFESIRANRSWHTAS
jgi:prevent-host-death family protein